MAGSDGQGGMIGVLGPPVVAASSGTRRVPGHPGRLLVAMAAAEEPLGIERLSDVLWGERPPATARSALHVHLGALRRVLDGDHEGASIERSERGYRLLLGTWTLDADLAATEVDRSRELLPTEPAAALTAARAALTLWRGDAYAVDGSPVDVAAARWADALRVEAEEHEVEALLALGETADAERLALRLVEAEPYRELRWGQLLRARYLAGRVHDALVVYREARRTLGEGLGLEPGPMLRELELAVLTRDDAHLDVRGVSARAPSLPAPARSGPIFGRDAEIARCTDALTLGRPVVVYGLPGVGKSRLAAEVAHRYPPAAVVWVDLSRHEEASNVLRALEVDEARGGVPPAWARSGAVRLLVLDDAEQAPALTSELIGRLGRGAPELSLLVTSRTRLDLDAVFVPLSPLPVPPAGADADRVDGSPAVQALGAALADLAPDVELSREEAVTLCRQAGGIPLALRLAAAAARATPVAELAAAIRKGLRPAVETVLQLVTADARTTFRRLGALHQGFDVGLAAAITGQGHDRVAGGLFELADVGLVHVTTGASEPYSLSEPLRDVAEQLLREVGEQDVVMDGFTDWCLRRAVDLERAALSTGDALVAAADVVQQLPRFRRVIDWLHATGDDARALRLVGRLDAPLYLTGRWPERNRLMDLALSIPGPATGDRALVHALRGRAGPLSALDGDRFDAAERIATEAGADRVAAYARHLRGILRWWSGDHEAAIADQRAAASVLEALDDLAAGEARRFEAVAMVSAGEHAAGMAQLRAVAAGYRRERTGLLAHTLAYAGHCHRFLGDDDAAIANWREALALFAPLGNDATAIHVQLGLAEASVDRGDDDAASRHVTAALDRIARSGIHEYGAWAWTVALRAAGTDDLDRAYGCARRGLETLDGVIPGEAARLASELAVLAADLGDWTRAARLLGCAEAHLGPRELPFPPPAETARRRATEARVAAALGDDADRHRDAGRAVGVAEAAGGLIPD
jgi:DNA-binding SARP family transcriptional activator/tetratricopeptide (TPR) repeat protein